ncbi:SLC13 family permease [Merdibacter massiliensis]|uniref:SLC13 family permease n=1 Tax=Merdibacter massiliensis TaxID=1871030 RepID=UPI00096A7D8D|nr:SLC13 family permease [Merdibacter massiliensis]
MVKIQHFIKKEPVCCIAMLLAILSAWFVHPDQAYLAYPDYRTIALLFCLMIIIEGLSSLGLFSALASSLLKKTKSIRGLACTMVLLCFFSSMIITNDVTLITFAPFTILLFRIVHKPDAMLKVLVLETIAANLGSMATPIGNPQNLYLYSVADFSMQEFLKATLPYTILSLFLLILSLATIKNGHLGDLVVEKKAITKSAMPKMSIYLILLILALLVVFHVLPYTVVFFITVAVILLVERRLFKNVDYFLLLTFLFFFLFIGNMKRIPFINELLSSLLEGHALIGGVLMSQIISNVPAAILLSGFTNDLSSLLTGVNLGGLGTLIASLASLITFKFYANTEGTKKGQFLKVFTLYNVIFLLILLTAAFFLIH